LKNIWENQNIENLQQLGMELNDDILKRVTERVIKFGKKTDGFT
jgi:hypothetical protein